MEHERAHSDPWRPLEDDAAGLASLESAAVGSDERRRGRQKYPLDQGPAQTVVHRSAQGGHVGIAIGDRQRQRSTDLVAHRQASAEAGKAAMVPPQDRHGMRSIPKWDSRQAAWSRTGLGPRTDAQIVPHGQYRSRPPGGGVQVIG